MIQRTRLIALLMLAAAAAAAALYGLTASTPSAHSHGGGSHTLLSASGFVVYVGSWALMSTAMMLPSATAFASAMQRIAGGRGVVVALGAFVGVWAAVGALLWAWYAISGQWTAQLAVAHAGVLTGVLLIAAACYQLSPLAQRCQRACSRPFGTIARHWGRPGLISARAMRAGGVYGLSCVGCCINMIALMLVVGMASPLWTLGLTAAMAVQKHATWGPRLRVPFSVGLSLYGAGLAAMAISG